METLTQDHMDFISTLEPDVFIYILSSISEGLTGLGKHNILRCTFIITILLKFSSFETFCLFFLKVKSAIHTLFIVSTVTYMFVSHI